MARRRHKRTHASNPRRTHRRATSRRHYSFMRANPRRYRRRRNPSVKGIGAGVIRVLPVAASVAVGFVGARTGANLIFSKSTGYVRAGVQAGIGVAIAILGGMLTKKKELVSGAMTGAFASAILTAADTLTGGKWSLSDEMYYVGPNAGVAGYLDAGGVSGYIQNTGGTATTGFYNPVYDKYVA